MSDKVFSVDGTAVDLHSHSTASDGTYSPQALLAMACERGLTCFAITDHDTMAGYLAVKENALTQNVSLIAGVEISCTHPVVGGYGKQTAVEKIIHVVALDVADVTKMQTALQEIQASRENRGRAMVEKLSELVGEPFAVLWQAVLEKAGGEPTAVGRAHMAAVLFERGFVKSMQDAFDKYLADDKPAYVPIKTLSMQKTVRLIHECGGLAVLAHPTRYRLSATRIRRLIEDFAVFGGDAVELPSASEPVSTRQMIDRSAAACGLLVSVGSDFHGTTMPWRKLGVVPKLTKTQVGIWTKFRQ